MSDEPKCVECGKPATSLGPCPYADEICDDQTPVPLCDDCYHDRCMEI